MIAVTHEGTLVEDLRHRGFGYAAIRPGGSGLTIKFTNTLGAILK